jgi:hypothetical protein
MNRLLLGVAMLGAAALLGGCPIYSNQGAEYRVCQGGGCYSCPDTSYSGACINWQCSQNSDCDPGYVCNDQAECVPQSTYGDGGGEEGDCSVNGCPDGYVCKLSNGTAQCVSLGGSDAGTDASSGTDSGTTDAATGSDSGASTADSGSSTADSGGSTDSGTAGDTSSSSDAPSSTTNPCNADTDCGGNGSKCVNGECAAQVDLCSDATQCVVAGEVCVDGLCEPTCNATTPCPSGYACDFTRGVCNLDPDACSGSGTSTCQGGAICVETHCVPPCSVTEGGAACAAGQVCVNGGCIPNQAASFACLNDGDQGLLSNTCASGYTCLHHDCYLACDVDASASACGSQTCKDVTIETGTYGVCAAVGTLGSQCDPAQGKYCATGVCINGSCE